jgi:TolB-like protein
MEAVEDATVRALALEALHARLRQVHSDFHLWAVRFDTDTSFTVLNRAQNSAIRLMTSPV